MKIKLYLLFVFICSNLLAKTEMQLAANVAVEKNVIYGMHGGLALLMDVYQPENANGAGIIVIPGSGFHQLISYDAKPLNDAQWYLSNIVGTDNLIKHGYTLFVVNHRAAPIYRYPAGVQDVQRAVQFIRFNAEKYQVKKEKIGAIGHSSGAYMASMLGVLDDGKNTDALSLINKESSKVQAVVGLAGIFDFFKFASEGEGDIGAVASFVGTHLPLWRSKDSPKDHEIQLYKEASPINYVTDDDAATLLIHGVHEEVCPISQSQIFDEKLRANGLESKLIVLDEEDHGLKNIKTKNVSKDKYYDDVIKFFNRHLLIDNNQ